MFRLRMITQIIRSSGLGHITLAFAAIFFACAVLIKLADPIAADGWGDALWFCFQAVSTIGFGDIALTSHLARIVTVVLSVVSIFYLAVITGVVVAYCNDMNKVRREESTLQFLDQLEHLDEMDAQQLKNLSAKIRKVRIYKGTTQKDTAQPHQKK